MADVTISALTKNLPRKESAVIPYSDGNITYAAAPSGIVAAAPGCIINVNNVLNETAYTFDLPTNATYVNTGMSVTNNFLYNTSKILVQAHIYGQKYYVNAGNVPMVLQLRLGTDTALTNFVGCNAIASNGENLMSTYSFSVMHALSPYLSVTSLTYTIWAKCPSFGYGGGAFINKTYSSAGPWTSMFTFFEMAG
jgi:hypothetical protein